MSSEPDSSADEIKPPGKPTGLSRTRQGSCRVVVSWAEPAAKKRKTDVATAPPILEYEVEVWPESTRVEVDQEERTATVEAGGDQLTCSVRIRARNEADWGPWTDWFDALPRALRLKRVEQAYLFALDPTPKQVRKMSSHVGGSRFAFNWGLSQIFSALDAYREEKDQGVEKPKTKIPDHFQLCKMWTSFKNDPENGLDWAGENFVGTYQAALRDAAVAWKRFDASRRGKLKGRRVGRPKFKSRERSRASFQVHGNTLRVVDGHNIKMPVIGVVKTLEPTWSLLKLLNKGEARLIRGTVSRAPSGRWKIALTVSVLRTVRSKPSRRQQEGGVVGVDFGVKNLATLSTGQVIENPRYLKARLRKLQRAGREYSRTEPGSNRREKARRRLAKVHEKVAHLRLDGIEKVTTDLIRSHTTIVVEGWDVQQTAQKGSKDLPKRVRQDRNRALGDTAIGMARNRLQMKAEWYGAKIVVAGKHTPTGRTCSECSAVRDEPVPLTEVKFDCPSCGVVLDRRVNTARVLAKLPNQPDDT